jgi:hypothetical protein
MTRRAVRVIWILVGLCLAFGVLASIVMLLGAPDRPWQQALHELSTLLDVVAASVDGHFRHLLVAAAPAHLSAAELADGGVNARALWLARGWGSR